MTAVETGERYTALVVEDDATHQLLIRKALESEGTQFSQVQFARDSDEANRYARQMAFDVMLFDNRIPGTRGLDLISELRNAGVVSPFVLMTSAGSEDLVVQAYRKNVSDYVIKDSGFWKELPTVLLRVIKADRAKKREQELMSGLERANAKLDEMNSATRRRDEQVKAALVRLRAAATSSGDKGTLVPILDEIDALL